MNRVGFTLKYFITGVPRASGDEPALAELAPDADLCSPRQRG